MNDLKTELVKRVFYDEEIEDIMPYDLSGYTADQVVEILYIYARYGNDPDRRRICETKRRELMACRQEIPLTKQSTE